ncbi:subtilase family protein [Hydrogenophaga sp. RAC07]|uniref:S8 family serine peptidase n=1 Tax=Hydrogenophaga sp. RAC07 TaxID=1842537 RepID=UPI000855CA66|nr:S8 family serine peptidase [Hydrogenophaga sp. RAC07]AOF87215.1 subtilase family protein [Hydrogenophaga sp. RAC07]
MWMLLLHAAPPIGWLPLDGAPWVGQARADDGDDGGDGDDGSASDGGASSAGSDAGTGGQDTDPGPRVPELPVQADGFSATELIALDPSPAALQRAAQWGARVVETSVQAGLGVRVVRLRLPQGIDARTALAVTNERDPGVFDLHHFYQLDQAEAAGCEGASCEPMQRMDWPAANARCGRGQTIGIVDSGVNTGLSALRGADLRVRRFVTDANATTDASHGTAVATLLVGQPGAGLPGLLPRASLRAAEPFFRLPSGTLVADALGLVKSLDWLVGNGAGVIGMSLTGPPNRVLQAAIERVQARGVLVVASVGNGGRNAAPAHPAALDGVLGATALSADLRIYWRANQGDTVDFALPGVALPAPDAEGIVRPRSGTSYAVPFLVAQLSQSLHEGLLSRADWQGGRAVPVTDLGAAGRDPVFGWGLPKVAVRCG